MGYDSSSQFALQKGHRQPRDVPAEMDEQEGEHAIEL